VTKIVQKKRGFMNEPKFVLGTIRCDPFRFDSIRRDFLATWVSESHTRHS